MVYLWFCPSVSLYSFVIVVTGGLSLATVSGGIVPVPLWCPSLAPNGAHVTPGTHADAPCITFLDLTLRLYLPGSSSSPRHYRFWSHYAYLLITQQ